jgi:hypothetical protein
MGAKKRVEAETTTFTLKFSAEERELVGRLIASREKELRDATGQDLDVTIASYLRWLIDKDAQARGLKNPARGK